MGKSSVKESMWIYFIDFSENLFGFQFFFITFAAIKKTATRL